MNKIFLYIFITFIIVVISSFATYYFVRSSIYKGEVSNNDQTFCILDAKLCPDGSYVGREGPNCEFKKCP